VNIAIIPARGGSKRIPRKNIKLFHGLPVIAYAIQAARESEIFDEVFVSTDDEEIAEIAKSFGATIPWMRSRDLSDDYTTTVRVMQDAVGKLDASLTNLRNVCCLYPATPLLKSIFLSESYKVLEEGNWKYVFAGVRQETSPSRFFSMGSSGGVEMLFPEHLETRTQDLVDVFADAGQFYWGQKSSWLSALPIFSQKSTIIEIPRKMVLDIDTLYDWQCAENIFATQTGDM
jgi:N-acylneuraminate cytidylyltransferase